MGCTPAEHPQPRDLAKTLPKRLKSTLLPQPRDNAKYDNPAILWPVLDACRHGTYVDQTCQDLRLQGRPCPTGDAVFYRLHDLTVEEVLAYLDNGLDTVLSTARCMACLPHDGVVALDTHDVPYYGEDRRFCVGTKKVKGTNWAHRFFTVNAMVHGHRFCLGLRPVFELSDRAALARDLVASAREWMDVEVVLADREFAASACLKVFDAVGVDYLVAVQRNARIKAHIQDGRTQGVRVPGTEDRVHVVDYEVRGVETTLLIYYERTDEGWEPVTYFTSLDVDEDNVVERVALYRSRWGIETAYRVKEKLRVRTNALSYPVRLLLFALAVLLYDVWVLVNALLIPVVGWDGSHYPVTLYRFCVDWVDGFG